MLPAADHPPLTRLFDDAGDSEHTLGTDQATLLAILLRHAAAHRHLKKAYAEVAARLGRAAACAAVCPQPWTTNRRRKPPVTDIDARLDAATTTVLAEISRTDAKSGVLLTAFSLPLAALVAAVPGHPLAVLRPSSSASAPSAWSP
ncbi:hypothetical protein ACIQRD_31000 [Streptomyces angustmyceticus]|uniref:DUF7739 domain-containing protein n=1 Tax=Streptomyces angustmyceticus TaxID=285578 RepID=UPI00382C78A3